MLNVTINRTVCADICTQGVLHIEGYPEFILHTLERPWKDNDPDTSCIPEGVYTCIPHGWEPDTAVHMKKVWEITNVPNRSAILIHPANLVSQLRGCVAAGLESGEINGLPAVLNSKAAIGELQSIIGENDFILTIINP